MRAIISFTHYQKLTQWHLITAPEAQASLINQRNKVRDDALNKRGWGGGNKELTVSLCVSPLDNRCSLLNLSLHQISSSCVWIKCTAWPASSLACFPAPVPAPSLRLRGCLCRGASGREPRRAGPWGIKHISLPSCFQPHNARASLGGLNASSISILSVSLAGLPGRAGAA